MDACIVKFQPHYALKANVSAAQMLQSKSGTVHVIGLNVVNIVPSKLSSRTSFAPCILPRHSTAAYARPNNRSQILAIKYSGPSEGVRQPVFDVAAGIDLSDSVSKIGRDVDRQVGGINRDLQDSFRSLDQDLDRVGKSIRDIGKNTQREFRVEVPGSNFRRESFQQEVQGGWTQSYDRSLAANPSGGSGLLIFGIILAGAYIAVARKFWENFRNTKYKASSRLTMSLQWPVLLADSGFRAEMRKAFNMKPKALKSSKKEEDEF